jgi:hypothetical protein
VQFKNIMEKKQEKKQNTHAYNASIKRLTLLAKMLHPELKRIPNALTPPKNPEKLAEWKKKHDRPLTKATIRYFAERPEFTDNRATTQVVKETANDDAVPTNSVKY